MFPANITQIVVNLQKVLRGQGNLSLLFVQADQQHHDLQRYPEAQADQDYPAKGHKERNNVVRNTVYYYMLCEVEFVQYEMGYLLFKSVVD